MYYQQGNTEMEGDHDGLQTLYLMNNYISYATESQFMGIPQSHQDPSRLSHDHDHHRNFLWGQQQQQQTPKGLSLSLGDDDQGRLMINTSDDEDVMKSSVIMGSKYLKAAQELLDELVSVVVAIDKPPKMITKDDHNNNNNNNNINNNNNCGPQLTSAQRQEFLIKKTKLNSMLDEVEQRHKQYHQQMQIMVTSFQQVAGNGSAKTYTQLALKTILKQFRCLKNTISSQIKALCKTLGEEEDQNPAGQNSRLKFVDHDHLRQQQLGMMQSNNTAWRPQRGLPEKAVSVLRAWLFEHFLHPYPKDSDKHTLAKQTGLTRSQVSNWFINARVRLWKPMVEDMYLEEIKNQETVPDNNMTKNGPHTGSNSKPSNPRQAKNNKPALNLVTPPSEISSASTIITKSPTRDNIENPTNNNPKKPRNDNSPPSMLSVDMERDRTIISKGFNDDITLFSANPGQNMESYLSSSGFSNGYGMSVGGSGFQGNNINNNNNFSLTLALPPSGNYSQGTQHQNFLSHRNFEFGTRIEPVVESNDRVDEINNRPDGSHPNINGHYEILDFPQNRKSFSSRLIPDHHFVT